MGRNKPLKPAEDDPSLRMERESTEHHRKRQERVAREADEAEE